MNEKLKSFLKNCIGYIIATIVTAAYIALSILTLDRSGKTVSEIIGSGLIFYIYQIILVTVFRYQGISNGERSEKYIATTTLHGEKVDEIADEMDALDVWCEVENEENYKRMRRRILAGEGMKYADYFDADGIAQPYEVDPQRMSLKWMNRFIRRKEKKRIAAYNKAVGLKLSKVDSTSLTSNNRAKDDKFNFGETKKQFMGRNTAKDSILKALPAILFGLYSFKALENWTWANLVWTLFQAVIGFASAVPEMLAAQSFIVDDFRGGIVKKIGFIDKFRCDLKNNPEKYGRTKEQAETEKKETEENEDGKQQE